MLERWLFLPLVVDDPSDDPEEHPATITLSSAAMTMATVRFLVTLDPFPSTLIGT